MRQVRRLLRIQANGMPEQALADAFTADEMIDGLSGYILEPLYPTAPPGQIRAWGCIMVITSTLEEAELGMAPPSPPPLEATNSKRLPLRPIGRLVPMVESQSEPEVPEIAPNVRTLRPVRSGRAYRISSPPERGLVRPDLAKALETVFDSFANERDFTPESPLEIHLARGFKAGSHGHGAGRAADIVAVDGKSLLSWKQELDRAMDATEQLSDEQQQAETITAEKQRNVGFGLYKALQAHGGWLVDKKGWRPYRGVMQLFGPWTATEGPWKAMHIKQPNPYQQRRLADQQWVFKVHQDHIHVAR